MTEERQAKDLSNIFGMIKTWTPESDVRAFIYGGNIITSSVAISAAYVNHRFRRALKLRNFALLTTYAATVCIPAAAAPLLHAHFVVRPVLLGTIQCPVCVETRSSLIQMACGLLYPMLLSPLACLQFANTHMTVAVPSITQSPKLVLQKVASIIRPVSKKLLVLAAAQAVVGAGLCYWEQSNLQVMVAKLEEMEKALPEKKKQELMRRSQLEAEMEEMEPPEKAPKYAFGLGDF